MTTRTISKTINILTAARVCREAGGRVSVNQYVRDLDIAAPTQPKTADWRWLQISLCSMACSWPSTLRWFPLSVAQGFLMQGVLMSMGQRPWQHEEGNSGWRERMDMRGWWSLRVRLEGDLRGMSPLPPPVVHVESTGRATFVATAGATRLASPLGVDVGVQRGPCSGFVVAGAMGRTWRGWSSTSEA